MKRFLLFVIMLFTASAAFPQNADVVELTPAETVAAKSAYENLQKAQAEWDKVR